MSFYVVFLALLLFRPGATFGAQPSVFYDLSFPNAVHHEAEVSVTFQGIAQPVLEVVMSRSSPGRYALHEFAKNVYNFRATDAGGHPLTVTRPNPYGWNIAGHDGTIVVTYTLFGDRVDGTYSAIDETHAHLNLPATLAWAHGFEHVPATLRFHPPADSGWSAATQLTPNADGTWSAPNLEWLMDSPVELSRHDWREWKVDGQTFRVSLHHHGSDAEAADFAEKCKTVVLEEEGVFGSLPKFDGGTYTFLVDYLPYANGDGMEHRDSTVITGASDLKDSMQRAIGTVSHEFFHSWNMKRIRPRSLEPFDFEHANMSGELWFAEGFTNYYGLLVLKRANLSSLDEFSATMGAAVNQVLNAPGRNIFDAVDMSRLAPFVDAATAIDVTNTANTFISYYTYGQALALGIDLATRARYPGRSLDVWMRAMWHRHPDIDRPYSIQDLEQALAEVTDQSFASEIFTKYILGLEPMEFKQLLAPAGLQLQLAHPNKPWLGARSLTAHEEAVEIQGPTLRGSPLYNAGLDRGDDIRECDGKVAKSLSILENCVAAHHPGESVALTVGTRAGIKHLSLLLVPDPTFQVVTYEHLEKPITGEITAFRDLWLGSKSPDRDAARKKADTTAVKQY